MSYEEKPNKKLDELLKHGTVVGTWSEYCKVREEINQILNNQEELKGDYQDLEFRYNLLKDYVIKMNRIIEGDYSFLQPFPKETK